MGSAVLQWEYKLHGVPFTRLRPLTRALVTAAVTKALPVRTCCTPAGCIGNPPSQSVGMSGGFQFNCPNFTINGGSCATGYFVNIPDTIPTELQQGASAYCNSDGYWQADFPQACLKRECATY